MRSWRVGVLIGCAAALLIAWTSVPPLKPYADGVVLVGAGDIASCGSEGDDLTANLLDNIEGIVFTAGDTVQDDGTAEVWERCYDPTWGRHKARTRPALGNHEHQRAPNANPYFDYFGEEAAGPRGLGYYSYYAGSWLVIVLNSMLPAHAGTPQYEWAKATLAANPTACALAIWHHPVYSSGLYGVTRRMNAVWRMMMDFGVDVVVSGDAHHYERFAPMDANGRRDPERGIRQFVVGTGGGYLTPLRAQPFPATEYRQNQFWGVLKLVLGGGGYSWEFINVRGEVMDSGSAPCR
ncbi:MAG: metallophosphoesterase family protein [Aggregatilineales bacterium]